MSIRGFKTQLKDALSSAVSYFQDGGDPNAACVKAANEAGFNADQADRLVETFNTARVICHYKAASDKAGSCSLADKEKVRGQLTPPAQAEKHASFADGVVDYDCYKQAEVDYVVHEVKMAEFEVTDEPLSKENADYLAVKKAEAIRDCVKTATEEARLAYAQADTLAEKVAMALSRNVSIDDVHDKMARIVAAYALDDRYAVGVEKVAAFLPVASDPDLSLLKKYAAMHVVDTSDLDGFVSAIKEASDFAAEGAAMEAYAASMLDELKKQGQAVDDDEFDGKTKDDLDMLLLKERILGERQRRMAVPVSASSSGRGSGGGGSGGSGSSGGASPSSFIAYLAETARDYDDNAAQKRVEKATAGVNNLRRQLILQDLLVKDKILSQEDPNAVAAAFRSINQISPDTTLNKEVLRSMLRGTVQSVALSPYDAKTLADIDKSRRQAYDAKTTSSEGGKGGKRNG